jgi:hypothetical protein
MLNPIVGAGGGQVPFWDIVPVQHIQRIAVLRALEDVEGHFFDNTDAK